LRQAIPASLDDNSTTQDSFKAFETALLARANGEPPPEKPKRWSRSKRKT
jgi:hypothetical protein